MHPAVDASAPPLREAGLRSRAGNAMARTRSAVLDGAARAVEKHGARRATMADIAMLAGIAKGTLYNHFRTKDAVYAAAVDAGVAALADECAAIAADDLAEALAVAADRLGTHPSLRRVAADDPALVAALSVVGDSGGWQHARDGVRAVLTAAGARADAAAVEVLLRWLVSFVGAPGGDADAQARCLARAVAAPSKPSTPANGAGDAAAESFGDGSVQLTL